MSKKFRSLALLLVFSLVFSLIAVVPASASVPETFDVAAVVAAAESASTKIESGILAGQQDVDGVYYDVRYPATVTVGAYEIGSESFVYLAAQAIVALAGGKADTHQVSCIDISLAHTASTNGVATQLNRGQYVELAERVTKYASTMHQLPGSFNRPTDGTHVYDGRITLFHRTCLC